MGKISEKQAQKLVEDYKTGNYSYGNLSEKYHISRSYAFCLVHGMNKGTDPLKESELHHIRIEKYYRNVGGDLYKTCKICKKSKPADSENFYFDSKGRIKYSRCKVCHRKKSSEYRKRKLG